MIRVIQRQHSIFRLMIRRRRNFLARRRSKLRRGFRILNSTITRTLGDFCAFFSPRGELTPGHFPLPFWPRGERPTPGIAVSTLVPSRVELAPGMSDLGGVTRGGGTGVRISSGNRGLFSTPRSPGATPKISPSEKRPSVYQ